METFQLIEEFFESTTVHGFAYIHSRYPKISRLLWVCILITIECWATEATNIYILDIDSPCRIDALWLPDFSGISRLG